TGGPVATAGPVAAAGPAAAGRSLAAGGPPPTILALHHPPEPPSSHPWFQLAGAAELLDGLVSRPQVRLVLSGHLHQPFEGRRGHLGLLGAPSTLYGIRHRGSGWEPDDTVACGARVLHLDPDGDWSSELVGISPEVGAVGGPGSPGRTVADVQGGPGS
ncbi:MAG: hypothetical protein M0T80_15040, partial [Actinomycetota bacterium]|nr:hypothetical protein [Actinomycetota bacterium]